MIKVAFAEIEGEMVSEGALPVRPEGAATDSKEDASPERQRALVKEHFAFVWRSLLRLGVPRADAEDALQEVFLVASRKLARIDASSERPFLFGTALKIASRVHRTRERRREVHDAELGEEIDRGPGPEELLDRARARAELDRILDRMALDLRAVFVLFELEQMTMIDISAMLDMPMGTVASRLRRAREQFQDAVRRRETSRKGREG